MATEAIIFQQIVDINWDQAIYTASPNNTINVVQFAAKGSGTNIGIALTPKGTGYISAQVPDGTTAGGNARGERCLDLQFTRTAANQVSAGQDNFLIGNGNRSTTGTASNFLLGESNAVVNGYRSYLIGANNSSSSPLGYIFGESNSSGASQVYLVGASNSSSTPTSFAFGVSCQPSGGGACIATGNFSRSHLSGMRAHGAGGSSTITRQEICIISSATTTTNAEQEFLNSNARWVLRSNTIWSGILTIVGNKSDGSSVATYNRRVSIKRIANTTTLVGSIDTVGTDEAAGTSISVSADDTNEALKVTATGVLNETWGWVAMFHGLEKTL